MVAVSGFLPWLLLHLVVRTRASIIDAGRGAVEVHLPGGYRRTKSYPLVLLLPGYGTGAAAYNQQFGLKGNEGVIQVLLEGRKDVYGMQYWMAWGDWTGMCNDEIIWYKYYYYFGENPGQEPTPEEWWTHALKYCGAADDDVLYIRRVVAATATRFSVDLSRVVAYGHGNGAAMAYRLACDASDLVTGIITFAGAAPLLPPAFLCARPLVAMLNIHGTEDTKVLYQGKASFYKSAARTTEVFMERNGCNKRNLSKAAFSPDWDQSTGHVASALDLSARVSGYDTQVYQATEGCALGHEITLWKIVGETHDPSLNANYYAEVLKWVTHKKLSSKSAGTPYKIATMLMVLSVATTVALIRI